MLDDIEQGVDRSNVKLDGAMKRMRKFIHDTEETKSGWCILVLIIVLLVLLLAVILV
jgi:syntaxin 6